MCEILEDDSCQIPDAVAAQQRPGVPSSSSGGPLPPMLLDLQRFIFICRACLRLVLAYVEEVYPSRLKFQKQMTSESQKLAECIYDVRTLLQQILTDSLPMLNQRHQRGRVQQQANGRSKAVVLKEMAEVILEDAHATFVSCFHAFYPTGYVDLSKLCTT